MRRSRLSSFATAAAAMPITTYQPKIPWTWAASMMLPWMALYFSEMLSGAALIFTLRKFVDQPALVAFLSSLNIAFNFLVGAVASYLSDRIWTRWGRRRPFLLLGWTGSAAMLGLIPLAPNLGSLIAAIVLYQFFHDIAKPYEPLYNEVVPPPQRGRAGMLRSISNSITGLLFNGVMLAQFDREYDLSAFRWEMTLRGEHLTYWAGAALALAAVLFLLLGVREQVPPGGMVRERFRAAQFLRDVFGDRDAWMLYGLYACPMVSGAAAVVFVPLTLTEQVGLTKAQFGWIESITMLTNLFLFVPIAGFLVDRYSRLRLLQIAMAGTVTVNLALFIWLRVAPAHGMTPGVLLGFSMIGGIGGAFVALKYVIWGPLVFDYISPARFGTASAGFAFLGGVVGFVAMNLGGAWVQGFSALWAPRQGGVYDYSSIFILQFFLTLGALGFTVWFERRIRRGRVGDSVRAGPQSPVDPSPNGTGSSAASN